MFFTYIVPLACINNYPVLVLLQRPDPFGLPIVLQWFAPLFGFIFLLITFQFWHFGVRHYRSVGS